jgi:hypothetical protein
MGVFQVLEDVVRPQPVVFAWREVDVVDGDGVATRIKAMVPLPRFGNICARQFEAGEEYVLAPIEERSMASHRQYFAAIREAYVNLPEKIADRWPSSEHYRKWLLTECGYFDEKEFDCPDEKFAKRLATFIRTEDEYARISVHRPSGHGDSWRVIVRRAKSQAVPAMKKAEFEASKKDTLDLAEAMTSVPRGTLLKEAGKSA